MRECVAVKILDGVSEITTGAAHSPVGGSRTFKCSGSTTVGTGSATIIVQSSSDGSLWIDAATFDISLSTAISSSGFSVDNSWKYVRGKVTAISGTGASVTLWLGTIV